MGLLNYRTSTLDFNSRADGVNDSANQDHPAGAVIADGIVNQVCQQFTNQDAIPGNDSVTVKSIEVDVDIAREGLWRALRQDIEGDLVQVDVLGGRLRNVLLIGPSQSYELPEQPFKAGYCVIYLVKGRLACRRLRPQA